MGIFSTQSFLLVFWNNKLMVELNENKISLDSGTWNTFLKHEWKHLSIKDPE